MGDKENSVSVQADLRGQKDKGRNFDRMLNKERIMAMMELLYGNNNESKQKLINIIKKNGKLDPNDINTLHTLGILYNEEILNQMISSMRQDVTQNPYTTLVELLIKPIYKEAFEYSRMKNSATNSDGDGDFDKLYGILYDKFENTDPSNINENNVKINEWYFSQTEKSQSAKSQEKRMHVRVNYFVREGLDVPDKLKEDFVDYINSNNVNAKVHVYDIDWEKVKAEKQITAPVVSVREIQGMAKPTTLVRATDIGVTQEELLHVLNSGDREINLPYNPDNPCNGKPNPFSGIEWRAADGKHWALCGVIDPNDGLVHFRKCAVDSYGGRDPNFNFPLTKSDIEYTVPTNFGGEMLLKDAIPQCFSKFAYFDNMPALEPIQKPPVNDETNTDATVSSNSSTIKPKNQKGSMSRFGEISIDERKGNFPEDSAKAPKLDQPDPPAPPAPPAPPEPYNIAAQKIPEITKLPEPPPGPMLKTEHTPPNRPDSLPASSTESSGAMTATMKERDKNLRDEFLHKEHTLKEVQHQPAPPPPPEATKAEVKQIPATDKPEPENATRRDIVQTNFTVNKATITTTDSTAKDSMVASNSMDANPSKSAPATPPATPPAAPPAAPPATPPADPPVYNLILQDDAFRVLTMGRATELVGGGGIPVISNTGAQTWYKANEGVLDIEDKNSISQMDQNADQFTKAIQFLKFNHELKDKAYQVNIQTKKNQIPGVKTETYTYQQCAPALASDKNNQVLYSETQKRLPSMKPDAGEKADITKRKTAFMEYQVLISLSNNVSKKYKECLTVLPQPATDSQKAFYQAYACAMAYQELCHSRNLEGTTPNFVNMVNSNIARKCQEMVDQLDEANSTSLNLDENHVTLLRNSVAKIDPQKIHSPKMQAKTLGAKNTTGEVKVHNNNNKNTM